MKSLNFLKNYLSVFAFILGYLLGYARLMNVDGHYQILFLIVIAGGFYLIYK